MRTCVFLLILTFGHLCALSQDNIALSGRVTDARNNQAIPFATVSLKSHPIGTVTNLDGAFTIYVPNELANDTLVTSHLAFSIFKIAFKDALKSAPFHITLSEKTILLAEVEVNMEQLSASDILKRALDRLKDNFNSKPFIMKGFFRDIREQNTKTVYLAEASADIQDPGFLPSNDRKKKFYLKGARVSDTRIHEMLSGSLLNSGNVLNVMLEHNFWLNSLKHSFKKREFSIEEIISRNGQYFYVIKGDELATMDGLADQYKDMQYRLEHWYYVNTKTFAIQKVEHRESPIEGKYVGIERPYEGDTLFYSKKGWNQIVEFEEYNRKMYLKYKDVSYSFDIVNQRQERVYLDMAYQFTFVVTDVVTSKDAKPEGKRMNAKRSLLLQAGGYDASFWDELSNAKLSPLTQKQLKNLSEERGLEEQFRSAKGKSNDL